MEKKINKIIVSNRTVISTIKKSLYAYEIVRYYKCKNKANKSIPIYAIAIPNKKNDCLTFRTIYLNDKCLENSTITGLDIGLYRTFDVEDCLIIKDYGKVRVYDPDRIFEQQG